jgi:hypothetical protein
VSDALADETCPHCGQSLTREPELGYRHARMVHLVRHTLHAALRLSLDRDVPDRSFWDAAEACDEDTWNDAALGAHDQVIYVIDSIGGLAEDEQEDAEQRAIIWLKQHYPEAFHD